MPHKVKAKIEDLISMYNDGFSCEKIANMYSMSRQAVWERLRRAKVDLRAKKELPFIVYDGIKFTANQNGYFRATSRDKNIALHRYKYEKERGFIPFDYDIHHIDGNKQNNNLSNLLCLSKSEHTKLHHKEKSSGNSEV